MNSDIVYALAAMVCYGVGDFIYKRAAAAGAAAEQFLMGQGWVFCPATIGYAWITRTLHVTSYAGLGGLAGLFLLHGMRHGQASVIVPITQMGFGIAAVLGVLFFKEQLTVRKIAGLGAAGIALLVLAVG